jgi:hypothetical protein
MPPNLLLLLLGCYRDLAVVKSGEDRTCLVQEPDMSGKTYKNSAEDPDKSG